MASKSANQLGLDVQRTGTAVVVRVRGSAGMGEAGYLKDQLEYLAESDVRVIVLDLADLSFISSAGLGALLSARARIGSLGGQIRLVHPQPFVRQILEVTHLNQLFVIFPNLDDALGA